MTDRRKRTFVSLRSDVVDRREPRPEDTAIKSELRDAICRVCEKLEGPIGMVARETLLGEAHGIKQFSRAHRANLRRRAQRIAAASLSRFWYNV